VSDFPTFEMTWYLSMSREADQPSILRLRTLQMAR